jgi:YVTN family beta-propeller protein
MGSAMTAIRRLLGYVSIAVLLAPLPALASSSRIYVTNSAGDAIHVVDPATNKVVQVIKGIEAAHGINFAADGSKVYVSNESTSTLDVFDRTSGKQIK